MRGSQGFFANVDYPKATRQDIQRYLNSIPANHYGLATRHAAFRAIRTFYRWLNSEFGIRNPMPGIPAPILGKPILPSLEKEQILHLIGEAHTLRDRAIIAFFVESGLRLSELANIKPADIDWVNHKVKKSWERAERKPTHHLGASQSNILRHGSLNISLMAIYGA